MSNTTMANLSPFAQTVLDALDDQFYELNSQHMAAAVTALRAVANQVAPIEYEIIQDCWYEKENSVREQLLAIADELERADV